MADPRNEQGSGETSGTRRPRPAYGEYAPEGWEWKPEGATNEAPSTPGAGSSQGSSSAAPAHRAGSGPVPGVPHNLGSASGSGSGETAPAQHGRPQPGRPSEPAPYRASEPQPPAHSAYPAQPGAPRPRTADRIITIVLLVIGAFGALITAQSMLGLAPSLVIIADALGVADFTVPDWVGTVGTVSGIAFIAVYAVVLIFSIQRMRARKIAFWIPLTAGVLVMIAMLVITSLVLTAMPELMSQLADPSSTERLLNSMYSEQ